MSRRIGNTVLLDRPVTAASYAVTVGRKEHEGPLGSWFGRYIEDDICGQRSFEQAESYLQKITLQRALDRVDLTAEAIDGIFGGDLQNQCTGSHYGLRSFGIPFIGMYGACSTMALSLGTAALSVESGAMRRAAAITSSHFCSAERQFRYPLEYGNQRAPESQWTVTGAGCVLLEPGENAPAVTAITYGRIRDLGITDIGNMGAAMAPVSVKLRPYPMRN